jgi:hypothetical protein
VQYRHHLCQRPPRYYIRTRLLDNRVIATTPAAQRLVTCIALEQGRADGLLCASLAGNHLHVDALCDAHASSRLVQRVSSSVKQRLALPQRFTHYGHEPIRDQRHLWHSVRYILTQHQRHGLPPLQALDGTNLPDLLGMRFVGAYTRERLRQWLPTLRREHLLEWLGLDGLREADGPVERVMEATLAAAALEDLRGSSPRVIAARRALVEVVGDRLSPVALAELVGVSRRTLFGLKQRPVDGALVRAVRLQLGARAALSARAGEWSTGAAG